MIGENDPTHIIPTSALSIEFLGQSISPGLNNAVTLDRYLMPGIPTRINFGVTAPYGTPIDIYNGQLSIVFY